MISNTLSVAGSDAAEWSVICMEEEKGFGVIVAVSGSGVPMPLEKLITTLSHCWHPLESVAQNEYTPGKSPMMKALVAPLDH